MTTDLILIANGTEARLLTRSGEGAELTVLDTVLRTEARAPAEAPRPAAGGGGWAAGALGASRAVVRPLDPLRRRMRQFAGVVAQRFEQELAGRRFDRVALFAACPFLSELMRQLSPATKKSLLAVVNSDISDLALPQAAQRSEHEMQVAAREVREAQEARERRPALLRVPRPQVVALAQPERAAA